MDRPDPHSPLPRNRRPTYRPFALLVLIYFAGFFFAFGLLLILPNLLDILAQTPPGPEQQEQAQRVAHETIGPRLPIVFLLAITTTALGGYFRVLPGIRPR